MSKAVQGAKAIWKKHRKKILVVATAAAVAGGAYYGVPPEISTAAVQVLLDILAPLVLP